MFRLSRPQQRGLLLLSLFIVGGFFLSRWMPESPKNPHRERQLGPEDRLVIELASGVQRPGLYFHDRPIPLGQVIEEAGGLTGKQILSPSQGSETLDRDIQIALVFAPGPAPRIEKRPVSARALIILGRPIPLNWATVEELDGLPGIGPDLALRIVEHRNNRGLFGNLEELRQVRGIGEKTLERLRPRLTVP